MKNLVKFFVVAFLWLSGSQMLHGQVVPTISVQGTLKDANGLSVSDGVYTVTFRLFNQETGGNPVWQEEATVEVVGGIYSHYLGSITPLNGANFANTLYMGLKVGNYELNPRTLMTYAPYTFSSNLAQKVVCSGAVGDIKYSILNPTQFATVNGDCWVPMDGRALASNSQLRQVTGMTSLPDVSGLFLRSQEFAGGGNNDPGRTSSTAIATLQTDDVKPHDHTMAEAGLHKHSFASKEPYSVPFYFVTTSFGVLVTAYSNADNTSETANAGAHTHTINNNSGTETRPKNLNVWTYIRIN